MTDRVFDAFLARQQDEGLALAAQSELFRLLPLGSPADRYIVEFRCKGLVEQAPGEVIEADRFQVGIRFPSDYLRTANPFRVLTWLGPRNVWHPNISAAEPVICIGRLAPGTSLVDIVYQVFEIVTWNKVTMREDDALNRAACQWARGHRDRFPVDRRPLKRRPLAAHIAGISGRTPPMAHQCDSRIDHALRLAASDVVYVGDGAWRLSFVNGSTVAAGARISDRWLELSAPVAVLPARDDLAWLALNAELEGTVKIARRLRDQVTRVVADVDLGVDDAIAGHVVAACGHVAAALHAIQGPLEPSSPAGPVTPRAAVEDIERACHAGAWRCRVTDGGPRIDLVTHAGAFTATVESSPTGDDRAVVQLADLSGFALASRQAAAALLLAASGAVRSIKGAVRRDADVAPTAVLIAPIVAPLGEPIDRALDLALSALAAACQLCAREIQALGDEHLAAAYLDLWNATEPRDSSRAMEESPCLQQR